MSPDPFFRSSLDFVRQVLVRRCQFCPQAKPGGFCGIRIQPDCLRIDSVGTVRVGLSAAAQEWFATLAEMGEVLHLTRNPISVIGRLYEMPGMDVSRNPVLPRDRDGLFRPNLAEYASLWALRETSSTGVMHGLEARDVSGTAFERVLLPVGSHREQFEQFVILHQSPPEESGKWFPPNHAWSARRRARLAARIPWLRSQLAKRAKDVRRLPVGIVLRLLQAAAKANLEICTTQYHRAFIRAVHWTPQAKPHAAPRDFFHGGVVGLHLNAYALASVWLRMSDCGYPTEGRWRLEIADAQDQVGLTLMSSCSATEEDWRTVVNSCLK